MSFHPYNQHWFYSKVVIPQIDSIKKELLVLYWKTVGNTSPNKSEFFFADYSRDELPSLIEFLDKVGLNTRWFAIGFAALMSGQEFPVHVDYTSGADRYIALNIPILNCENSYMVWYDAEIDCRCRLLQSNGKSNIMFPNYDDGTADETPVTFWCKEPATEILRVECTDPMFAHVGRPHRPVVEHNNLRVLATIRFRPELTSEDFKRLQIEKARHD